MQARPLGREVLHDRFLASFGFGCVEHIDSASGLELQGGLADAPTETMAKSRPNALLSSSDLRDGAEPAAWICSCSVCLQGGVIKFGKTPMKPRGVCILGGGYKVFGGCIWGKEGVSWGV